MKRVLVILAATLLSLLALANVAAATGPWSYQPEVPDKLLK
ncbi:AgrD family cyclic lactone autoinducer peptide [Neomoorella thermoacetica]